MIGDALDRQDYMGAIAIETEVRQIEAGRRRRQNRRARVKDAPGSVTSADIDLLFKLHNHQCRYCGAGADLHVEHLNPLARGGTNYMTNLSLACASDNSRKGTMTDSEYQDHIGISLPEPPFRSLFAAATLIVL